MAWESEQDEGQDVRDRTYLWWGLIAVVMIVGLGAVMLRSQDGSAVSRVRAQHIHIALPDNSPETIETGQKGAEIIRERIVNGENFGKLAKEFSSNAYTGARGGDTGWKLKGELDEAVESYVWTAPIGQVSEVIRGSDGFHIIKVTAREFGPADRYEIELQQRARPN